MQIAAYQETGVLDRLAGPARAAVLLLAMGPTGAGRLLKHLSPDEIRALRRGASDQASISPSELDLLVSEFQDAFRSGPGMSRLDREMKKLLEQTLSKEDLSSILKDERTEELDRTLPVWPQLEAMGAEVLRQMLGTEHPQIIALVLSRLSPDVAAMVVGGFAIALRNEVLRRMLVVKPLSARAEMLIENSIRDIHLADRHRSGRNERYVGLAEIVNRMEKTEADALLTALSETQPEETAHVRRLLFSFEDIPMLSVKARLILFDDINVDVITNALIGADETLKESVLSSLASRARRMVEAELSQPRDVDPKDVATARRAIATTALKLSGEGRLALPSAGADA